jgi:cardiolipin synthase
LQSIGPERNVWLTIPNALTVLRMAAVIPIAWLVVQGRDREALLLFIAAGVSDTLDGTIARRYGQKSKLGRLLDPLADKIFTGVSFIALAAFREDLPSIPMWVMAAVLLRDALILLGSLVVFQASHNTGFKPSVYGKLNTFLEIAVVVVFLAQPDFHWATTMLPALYVVLLISIVVSAADYFRIGLGMMKPPALTTRPRK